MPRLPKDSGLGPVFPRYNGVEDLEEGGPLSHLREWMVFHWGIFVLVGNNGTRNQGPGVKGAHSSKGTH